MSSSDIAADGESGSYADPIDWGTLLRKEDSPSMSH